MGFGSQQTPAEVISKDQNQMVSGIKGSMSWDLGSLFASKVQQNVHEQGPEPDGKWD
jgi:hypothetical protein